MLLFLKTGLVIPFSCFQQGSCEKLLIMPSLLFYHLIPLIKFNI